MQAALHQHARAAEFHRLADLLVDGLEIEDVPFFRRRPFQRPVEGAKSTVLGAEVRVVDVAVNNVGDHALGMQLAALRVGFHADPDQVIGMEHLQSLLSCQGHAVTEPCDILTREDQLCTGSRTRPEIMRRAFAGQDLSSPPAPAHLSGASAATTSNKAAGRFLPGWPSQSARTAPVCNTARRTR